MTAAAQRPDRAPGDGFLVAWAGPSDPDELAVQEALRAEGVRVDQVSPERLLLRLKKRAPDLVVLAGRAAEERQRHVDALAGDPLGARVPLVTVGPTEDARPKPRARYGLVARLDRAADADRLAAQLVRILHGVSGRSPRWRIEADVDDVPKVARRSAVTGRSGVLAATGSGGVAIDADGTIGPDPQLFVASLVGVPALELTLFERPPGTVRVLHDVPGAADGADLKGVRALVVALEEIRVDRLGRQLTEAGADVRVTTPARVAAHRAHDPMVILVTEDALLEPEIHPLWEEARYAAAGLLVLGGRSGIAPLDRLAPVVVALAGLERELVERLQRREAVAERLETLGAARWLKVLGRCDHDVTLRVFGSAGRARVDLSGGKIQGAAFHPPGSEVIEGRAAVEALLRLPFGRVLAGPPDALGRLDGARRARQLSIVGRIAALSPDGSGLHSIVTEEVSGKHTDATRAPRLARPALALGTSPELAPIDDDEESTGTYTAEHLAAMRAKLRETGDDLRLEDVSPAPDGAPPKDPLPEAEPPASTPPEPEPIEAASAPTKTGREPAAEPSPAASSAPAKPEPRERIAKRAPPAPSPREAPASHPEESAGRGVWFAIALVASLAAGGFAAWRLASSGDERERPAPPPAPVETPPPEPAPEPPPPRIEPAPAPRPEPVVEPAVAPPEAAGDPDLAATDEAPPDVAPGEDEAEATAPVETEVVPEEAEEPPVPSVTELPPPPTSAATVTERLEESAEAARARDYARSEALARQVLAASPRNGPAAYRMAVATFRQRRVDEAMEWAERAHEWDPEDPLPLSLMGDLFMRSGRFHQAARAYQRAVDVEPRFGPARRQLDLLRERGVVSD